MFLCKYCWNVYVHYLSLNNPIIFVNSDPHDPNSTKKSFDIFNSFLVCHFAFADG